MGETRMPNRLKAGVAAAAPYAVVLALCLFVLNGIFKVRSADLTVPFNINSDGMVYVVWVKGMMENGWYLNNPAVGAPAGLDMRDYPVPDLLHLGILKLLSLLLHDPAAAVNVYYLATFPFISLSAFFVLRRLHVAPAPAAFAALLYAFLPYHLLRNAAHLFLSAYYLVPLAILLAVRLAQDDGFLVRRPASGWLPRPNLASARAAGALLVALLLGLGGVYYAFFSCFFLGVAGAAACLWRRTVCPLLAAAGLIAVITAGVVVSVSPTLLYQRQHGKNPEVAHRAPEGAEVFGLKVIQMLLPINHHRLASLAWARAVYSKSPTTPLISENEFATLGAAGSIGFLVLVGCLLRRRAGDSPALLDSLSMLNVFGVLLATIGGFGSLFCFYVSPMIRAYNRISVFIAFLALAAVAVVLQALLRRLAVWSWPGRAAGLALVAVLFGVALLDEVPPGLVPTHVGREGQYRTEGAFIRQIEASVPPGTMIFQLPYMPFPECKAPARMLDYDHFRAYLHSHTLRWSYGAMRGREGDRVLRELASKPLPEMVEALGRAGFGGIYLDRFGFTDEGAQVEGELTRLLGAGPLVSGNGRLSFFNLADYGHREGKTDTSTKRQRGDNLSRR